MIKRDWSVQFKTNHQYRCSFGDDVTQEQNYGQTPRTPEHVVTPAPQSAATKLMATHKRSPPSVMLRTVEDWGRWQLQAQNSLSSACIGLARHGTQKRTFSLALWKRPCSRSIAVWWWYCRLVAVLRMWTQFIQSWLAWICNRWVRVVYTHYRQVHGEKNLRTIGVSNFR